MEFIIENCSSTGAHFSKNTNEVLLKINTWINDNNNPTLKFIEFRKKLQKEKGINDNNARNIYPLLKNCGFAQYKKGAELCSGEFFTNKGKAYIIALETKELIKQSDYTQKQKLGAIKEIDSILNELIFEAVEKLLNNNELNYTESMKWFLKYLLYFDKINKQEFAYMVYQMTTDDSDWYNEIKDNVDLYRKNELDLSVKVRVRNDNNIKVSTGEDTRLEDISYFTAYSFYAGLISQAGLIKKDKDYYYLQHEKRILVENLIK